MKVYLGDLGHYTIKLTNNHTPLGIGFIAAYMRQQLGESVDIRLFKHPDRLMNAIEADPPDVLALSNYIWCQSVSEVMFQNYKELKPHGITIWGGPNFPMNERHKAKQYLAERPYVDFYIPFEGETPAVNIVRSALESSSSTKELQSDHPEYFDGAFFLREDGELVGNNIGVQIPDINQIPSPYLEGWMDSFLNEGLHAMFETQRGCPFQCTFCHTGLDYYNRGRSFSLDRIKKEVEYIIAHVEDPTKTHLYITDSNFGMWPQDVEFSKWLKEVYEKTGFPLSFGTSTGKGRIKLVLETVLSHPKLKLTNSVQSLDDRVLKEIKRKNLPIDQLKSSQAEISVSGKISTPECILSLPLETRQSHLNTLRKLTGNIGANIIYQHTLMLLPGTEIYTDEARKNYGYNVKYRVLPTAFGEYGGKKAFEIEEVAAGTKDMPFDEYLEMRLIFFFVHNVYSNAIFSTLINCLASIGEDPIDFFLYLAKKRLELNADEFPFFVIENYMADTKNELFDSREALVEYYSAHPNYSGLLHGTKGCNLTHNYRTRVLLHAVEWANWVTSCFRDYLSEKNNLSIVNSEMVNSISRHVLAQAECQLRYVNQAPNTPSAKFPLTIFLDYDVPAIFAAANALWRQASQAKERCLYSYFMRDDAIKYINSFTLNSPSYGQRVVDLALLVLRMDQKYLFPLFKSKRSELQPA